MGSNRPAICIPSSYFVSNPKAADEQSSIHPNSVRGKTYFITRLRGPISSYLKRGSVAHLWRSG
jgi:hypothetical protein